MFLHPVPIQTQGIDTIPILDHEPHHTTEIETIQTVEIEVILESKSELSKQQIKE